MNIGLIGAGAVGSYFIWGFENSADVNLILLADEKRKDRLKKNGVLINDEIYMPGVLTAEECKNIKFDIILVCTKYSGLDGAIEILNMVSDDNTIIMSMLNGVDSETRIKNSGVKGIIIPSLIRIASNRGEKGTHFKPEMTQGIFFGVGRECNSKALNAVESLKKVFDNSDINYTVEDDIDTDIWIKYASNIANNLPQAILGTDASLYVKSKHGHFIADKLWQEVRVIAKTQGINLSKEPFIFKGIPLTSKYSTLQDIENNRHTEIDMFAGYAIKLAKENSIDVPYMEYTYHAIKAIEEKNDGIIGK